MTLLNWIEKLDEFQEQHTLKNTSVSKASVAWHLDHCYKVIIGIIKEMQKTDPANYSPSFNWKKWVIMKLNWFPRGSAKAPRAVNNREEISLNDLQKFSHIAKKTEKEVRDLAPNQYFNHPYFGSMNRDEAIDFLGMHTNHHLKIIRDILK